MAAGEGGRGGRGFLTEEEKQNRPKVTGSLLRRIFSYLLPYWSRLLMVLLAIVLSSVLGILPAILTGRIIDEGLIGRNLDRLLVLVAVSVGIMVLGNLIGVLQSYLNISMAQHITRDMRNRMYAHLQRMSHRFFTTSRQGDIITRMTSDISGVEHVISGTLTSMLGNVAVLVTSAVAMFQKSWLLASIGLLIVPMFIIPTKRVGRRRWQIALQSQERNDEINQILNETLSVSGQMLSKLFANEALEYRRYEAANREMARLRIRESMAGRWFRLAISTYSGLGPMLIYLTGGILMIRYGSTSLTVGDLTVMVALLSRMYQPVNALLSVQVDLVRSLAMFTRIFEYFDMPVEIRERPGAVAPATVRGELAFDHAGFAYEPDRPLLEDITFQVGAGRMVALVGASGAGKSTLISLIPRLYDVSSGAIRLDGIDLRDWKLDALRRSIGVVTQDTYLFSGTIRENLRYANEAASEADLVRACRQANIHDFIAALPQGYDTLVGNRGVKLSGGERQRVSIARVILKDPALVILDEATSALDSISERLIQDALGPLLRGKTSLVIAHRLSTIMAADEILVLEQGAIVERGTHEQLVERPGLYRELYETQFRRSPGEEE